MAIFADFSIASLGKDTMFVTENPRAYYVRLLKLSVFSVEKSISKVILMHLLWNCQTK